MDVKQKTLQRLEQGSDELLPGARTWLAREQTTLVTMKPVELIACKVAHLCGVRLKISRLKGGRLLGAENLLRRLDGLTPQKKLEQLSFSGGVHAGSIFFEKTNGSFAGL